MIATNEAFTCQAQMYAYTTCTCMIKQNVRFKFVYMYMKTTEFEIAKHIFCTNNRNEISKPWYNINTVFFLLSTL